MKTTYVRCGHCRGFYESGSLHCRYCGKDIPLKDAAGNAREFAGREICRAIQIGEYEQLPKEAHGDPMRPDPELLDRLCYCLHCGPEGKSFEAVEMRWMANEHMWACPCTTCGGRGFAFDIHLLEPLWQCVECQHWYAPANGDRRASNAKCPKCGCTMANGWFDDETEEEEDQEQMAKEWETYKQQCGDEDPEAPLDMACAAGEYAESQERMPDDIDFPHDLPKPGEGGAPEADDIPW